MAAQGADAYDEDRAAEIIAQFTELHDAVVARAEQAEQESVE